MKATDAHRVRTQYGHGGSVAEKISEKVVKTLTPPKHGNRILYDAQIPGFGVRMTATGAVSFILNYHVHGRERRFTIGKHPEWSVIAARNRALELRRKVNEGVDPLGEREQERTQPTMNDLCNEYLEHHALVHKRPHSVRDDKQMIAGIITPRIGTLQIGCWHCSPRCLAWRLSGIGSAATRPKGYHASTKIGENVGYSQRNCSDS